MAKKNTHTRINKWIIKQKWQIHCRINLCYSKYHIPDNLNCKLMSFKMLWKCARCYGSLWGR